MLVDIKVLLLHEKIHIRKFQCLQSNQALRLRVYVCQVQLVAIAHGQQVIANEGAVDERRLNLNL